MGYRNEYIADLEWEVAKLTEIKDKFKAKARELKKENERLEVNTAILFESYSSLSKDYITTQFDKDKLKDEVKEISEELKELARTRYTASLKKDNEILGLEEHVNYLHKIHFAEKDRLKREIDRLDSVLTQRTRIIEDYHPMDLDNPYPDDWDSEGYGDTNLTKED